MDKNTNKYANKGRTELRRTDREVTDQAWIKALLHRAPYGVLASAHQDQPFVTPINFVYHEETNALYFHGAQGGRMRANIVLNPKVSFNITEIGRFVPGQRMSEFGVDYDSVTVFGRAAMITDEREILTALYAMMEKYFPEHRPNIDYPPAQPDELKRTAVFGIAIEEWSGKRREH